MGRYLKSFVIDWFPKLMEVVLVLCAIAIVVIVFGQVWLRYLLHSPILWIEEVIALPAFWLYLLGASYGTYDRSHIRVAVIDLIIKNEKKRLNSKIIVACISFAIAVFFVRWGYDFFMFDLAVPQVTNTLRLPIIWARSAIFVCAILIAFYLLIEIIDLVGQRFGKPPLLGKKGAN